MQCSSRNSFCPGVCTLSVPSRDGVLDPFGYYSRSNRVGNRELDVSSDGYPFQLVFQVTSKVAERDSEQFGEERPCQLQSLVRIVILVVGSLSSQLHLYYSRRDLGKEKPLFSPVARYTAHMGEEVSVKNGFGLPEAIFIDMTRC